MDLNIVYNFIKEMNSSTSSNDKIDLIRFAKPEVRKVLFYTYNTFQQYNITPKVLDKRPDLCNKHTKFTSVFELLDSLKNTNIYRVYPHTLFCNTIIKNRTFTS